MRLPLALAALFAAPLAAQPVVLSPGHPDLSVEAVDPGPRALVFRMVAPEEREVGTLEETVSLDGDVLTVVAVADVPMRGSVLRDSSRFAWPSLAPLTTTVRDGDEGGSAEFGDGRVTGESATSFGPLGYELDLERPVFLQSALALIVRALPFEPGYQATVPLFSASERFTEATLTVVGTEATTRADGTEVEAVVVEQVGGGGMADGADLRHYLDPTTRTLLWTAITADSMEIRLAPASASQRP